MREHDVTALTTAELEDSRRELAASLALARPGSPVLVPIRARMAAIDAKLAGRAAARPGLPGSPACPASAGRAPGLRKTGPGSLRAGRHHARRNPIPTVTGSRGKTSDR